MKQTCNKCKQPKELNADNFHLAKKSANRPYNTICIPCVHQRQKKKELEKKMYQFN